MKIEVDIQEDSKIDINFFVSVEIRKEQAVSFDHTVKEARILKQILIDRKPFLNIPTDMEWKVIKIKNRIIEGTYSVKWKDLGKIDLINDEIWETVWKTPLTINLKKNILSFSKSIHNGSIIENEFEEFESLVEQVIKTYNL